MSLMFRAVGGYGETYVHGVAGEARWRRLGDRNVAVLSPADSLLADPVLFVWIDGQSLVSTRILKKAIEDRSESSSTRSLKGNNGLTLDVYGGRIPTCLEDSREEDRHVGDVTLLERRRVLHLSGAILDRRYTESKCEY